MEESKELYEEKTELLKALSHPLRLQIVRGLLVGGCHNVRCMEAGTGQSQSTISQHLMRLKAAGVNGRATRCTMRCRTRTPPLWWPRCSETRSVIIIVP